MSSSVNHSGKTNMSQTSYRADPIEQAINKSNIKYILYRTINGLRSDSPAKSLN